MFRKSERPWNEGTTLREYQEIARAAIGKDQSDKDIDDWCNNLWGNPCSPGANSSQKRRATEDLWMDRLCAVDEKSPVKSLANGSPARKKAKTIASENMVESVSDTSGTPSRMSLRAFNSMTNLDSKQTSGHGSGAHSSNTAVAQFKSASSEHTSALTLKHTPLASVLPSPPPSSPIAQTQELFLRRSIDFNDAPLSLPPTPPSLLPSLDSLLTDSVVWLASPTGTPASSRGAPSHATIPPAQLVHTLDAFLLACGWGLSAGQSGSTWVKQGVIFIDDQAVSTDDSDEVPWMDYPMKAIFDRRRRLLRACRDVQTKCKPVTVFSIKALDGGSQNRAICLFD